MIDLLQGSFQDFHFLRPMWFIGLLPAVLLFLLVWKKRGDSSNWENAIDPELLPHLLQKTGEKVSRSPLSMILAAWVITILALAGPVFKKIPQPVHEREDALIVLFDLSLSMYAEDVKPNRLIRARRKLFDLLEKRKEGLTGLIVYAGDAHTVSPLTDDTNTIASMIPAITPDLMPLKGSHLTPAIEMAVKLFHDAGISSGHLLIITDEVRDVASASDAIEPYSRKFPLSVLSVGTEEGAPIPQRMLDPDAGYIKDRNGVLVIPRVDLKQLRSFASMSGGRFSSMHLTDEDLDYLLAEDRLMLNETFREIERDFDIWHEEGPWLILLLLPVALLAFRRGWLWMTLVFVSINLAPVNSARASLWDDLWQTPDQQGQKALDEGRPAEAAEIFKDKDWRATALYRSENYPEAATSYGKLIDEKKEIQGDGAGDGFYNLGNSLAKQGEFEDAIKAYDEALKVDPDNEDAAFNKKLLESLTDEQKKQQQNQDGESDDTQDQKDKEQEQQDQQEGDSSDDSSDNSSGNPEQQDKSDSQEQTDQQKEEQADQQNKETDKQDEQDGQEQKTAEQMAEESEPPMDSEEQQALQQWLQRVPDDPGGLLRKKFKIQYQQRLRNGQQSREDPNANW